VNEQAKKDAAALAAAQAEEEDDEDEEEDPPDDDDDEDEEQVETEIGIVNVGKTAGDDYVAYVTKGDSKGMKGFGKTPDDAVQALLEAADAAKKKATAPEAPAKPVRSWKSSAKGAAPPAEEEEEEEEEEVKPSKPIGKKGKVTIPVELVSASSFRQVMDWMVKNGFTKGDAIVKKCEELRAHVPAVSRLSGELSERVERALSVIALSKGEG
jgi:hypothetical protein